VRESPPWFQAMVWMELLFQIPVLTYILISYIRRSKSMRTIVYVYTAQILTTMIPIMAHIHYTMPAPHKYCVMGIYAPWAILPTLMATRFTFVSDFPTKRRKALSHAKSV
jgi:hypothetical protein